MAKPKKALNPPLDKSLSELGKEALLNRLLAQENLVTEFQLDELDGIQKLCYLLQSCGVSLVDGEQIDETNLNIDVINSLPDEHAYPVNGIQALYFEYDGIYAFNFYERFSGLDDRQMIALVNYILHHMDAAEFVYEVRGFEIGIYLIVNEQDAKKLSLNLLLIDSLDEYAPVDLTQIYDGYEFNYMLAYQDEYNIPYAHSLSPKDGAKWLINQKKRILAWTYKTLPEELSAWQDYKALDKFRLIYNLFIALARYGVANGNVIDDKYKSYPLMDAKDFDDIIDALMDDDIEKTEKNIIDFFLNEKMLQLWISDTADNEQVKLILAASA